jgi:hypothetical protein
LKDKLNFNKEIFFQDILYLIFWNKFQEKKKDEKIVYTSETNFDGSRFWLFDIISNNCFVSCKNDDDDDVRAGGGWDIGWTFSWNFSCCLIEYVNDDDIDAWFPIDGRTKRFVDGDESCWIRSSILNIQVDSLIFTHFLKFTIFL